MDFILELLMVGVYISIYTSIAAAVWKLTGDLLMKKVEGLGGWDKTHPGPVINGAFWPIGLPITFPFLLYALSKRTNFRLLALPKKSAEQKVLNYATAPVTVLSQIVAQRIIREPENVKFVTEVYGDLASWVWQSSDKKIIVRSSLIRSKNDLPPQIKQLTVSGGEQAFDNHTLVTALRQAVELLREKQRNEAETNKQLKALSAVETLLLPENE